MGRILLVEDDTDVRTVMCEALAEAGYEVVPAGRFDEARRMVRGQSWDLMVCNLVLPGGGSGRDLAAEAGRRGIKTLLVTGDLVRLADAPEDGPPIMCKPFRMQEFCARIAALLADK